MDVADTAGTSSKDPAQDRDPHAEVTGLTEDDHEQTQPEEGDYCRICRGESSPDEPLFYPCKCSGSIKFVHQACLMEWLSHSQKKYCELCKTPYRFTKLYDPHMPGSLPTPIFLRQIIVHTAKGFLIWSRFLLVGLIWLIWLPWSMRQVWRMIFYLIDCRWSSQYPRPDNITSSAGFNLTNSTSVLFNLEAVTTNQSSNATLREGLIRNMPQILTPIIGLMGATNGQFLLVRIVQAMFPSFFRWTQSISADYAVNASSNGKVSTVILKRPTILGEIQYLKTLTTSPTINNTIIDILEGQLICLVLVIVSILLFLIREWVINQQPGIAADQEEANAAVEAQNVDPMGQNVQEANVNDPAHPVEGANSPGNVDQPAGLGDPDESHNEEATSPNGFESNLVADQGLEDSSSSLRLRPTLSGRNAMDDASSIQRSIEEQSRLSVERKAWPGLETFKDLWSRAEGDPSGVLKIIEQEGRQEELGWIVSQMRRLEAQGRRGKASDDTTADLLSFHDERRHRIMDGRRRRSNSTGNAYNDPDSAPNAFLGNRSATFLKSESQYLNNVGQFSPAGTSAEDIAIPPLTQSDALRDLEHFDTPVDQAEGSSSHSNQSTDTFEMVSQSDTFDVANDSNTATAGDAEGIQSNDNVADTAIDAGIVPDFEDREQLLDTILYWFWNNELYHNREEDQQVQDDEHVIENIDQEAPFVPVHPQNLLPGEEHDQEPPIPAQAQAQAPQDPEVAAAAAEAGIDLNGVDNVEEAEDLDGIMELIGVQGPLAGLIQNVVFSQFLISLTLMAGVGIPYIWGMFALHVMSNPISVFLKLPVAIVSTVTDIIVDTVLFSSGLLFYTLSSTLSMAARFIGFLLPSIEHYFDVSRLSLASFGVISRSGSRLEKSLVAILLGDSLSLPKMTFSAQRSLHTIENGFSRMSKVTSNFVAQHLVETPVLTNVTEVFNLDSAREAWSYVANGVQIARPSWTALTSNFKSLLTRATNTGIPTSAIDSEETMVPELFKWTAQDRVIATILGYVSLVILGFCYLKFARIIWKLKPGDKLEGIFADGLRQAGGVLKVILIIGIEMIIFPLYCGILLDAASLPLFQNATLANRVKFMLEAPLTGLFVHWFVGTCYMFHFALFVSMCRKLMRKGVLYFIRDPDDRTFHPVRDVLERNVATQLSKIAFSALIYGGLVMICLGGVVWGLTYFDGVLPIYWASGGPVLEFPIDLLFYSFALPSLIRKIKPSEKINVIYNWWFHKVAGWLRLSDFLFGEKIESERGRWIRSSSSKPEHSSESGPLATLPKTPDRPLDRGDKDELMPNGTFVRAPASDSVRIPKGQRVFLEVNEDNQRIDGQPDEEDGPHGKSNKDFTKVYIPPNFKMRIAFFVGFVWIFTAVVGVCVTILPLLVGRAIIRLQNPSTTRANDLYSFTLGVSLVLLSMYLTTRSQSTSIVQALIKRMNHARTNALHKIWSISKQAAGLLYLGLTLGFVLPLTLAFLAECFIFIPLHTYLASTEDLEDLIRYPHFLSSATIPKHTIYLVQSWSLGLLFLRLMSRLALQYPNDHTLLATALRSITTSPHSIWHPDIRRATRVIVAPYLIFTTILLSAPLLLGFMINSTPYLIDQSFEVKARIYRYSFPGLLAIAGMAWSAVLLRRVVEHWRVKIRDEVYLVGERLHNFGERRNSTNRDRKGKGRATRAGSDGGVDGLVERRVAVL